MWQIKNGSIQFINVLQKCMLQNNGNTPIAAVEKRHSFYSVFIHLFKEWKYRKICSATLFHSSRYSVWQWKMHQHFLKMLLPFTLMCIIYIFIEIQWCMHTLTFFLCCFAFLKKWFVISKNMIYGFWTRDDDEDDDDIVLVTEHILNSRIRYHKCKLSL